MNFFDVYLKRMNLGGTTRQERIKSSEENEFKLILARTKYKAFVYQVNDDEVPAARCSLQPSSNSENKIIFSLHLDNSNTELTSGDIVYTYQKIKDVEDKRTWLILHYEKDITKGYQTYKVICLDSFINITDEYGETKYTVPVTFVSATNIYVQDYFSYSKGNYGYRENQDTRIFITKDYDFLKKGTYFNYKDKTWELSGKDNVSVDNVSYTTISERLERFEEPVSSKEIPVSKDTNFFLNGR